MSTANTDDKIFKALADGRRRQILDLLKNKPMITGEICSEFAGLNRCTVMQHLGVLEKADLIIVKREGRVRWNYLNHLPIKEIYDRWMKSYTDVAVDFLSDIKSELESNRLTIRKE